ncbi:MAG: PadR family transcriptional regulator [Hyphomonadaceae bacterium]|nr:PadR family transcriptional regulator [Hyphomonadaceae bacterium]
MFSGRSRCGGMGEERDGHRFRGGRHWGARGGGGIRRGRLFDQGDLRLIALSLIAERPRHGYELIKVIEDALGGAYSPSPGVVYPTLTLLEELGHIALDSAQGGKKLYAITEAGRGFLVDNESAVSAARARLDAAQAAYGAGPPPQILRAMENLRTALRIKLSRGALSAEQIATIAKTLDEAAGGVERA